MASTGKQETHQTVCPSHSYVHIANRREYKDEPHKNMKFEEFNLYKSLMFIKLIAFISLPLLWDWRNVNGTNFLSPLRNQHQLLHHKRMCGDCWAMASSSVMADRMNIIQGNYELKNYISVQNILDCSGGGDCDGGDEVGVYKYAMQYGIPHDTCDTYRGMKKQCNHNMDCYKCDYDGNCEPVKDYERLYIKGYNRITGIELIKNEIYKHGPITCSLEVTDDFESYTKGVYKEYKQDPIANHVVSIVGWGIDNNIEFWIVRNSWGIFAQEDGFFRIVTSSYGNGYWNLGIEKDCSYPVIEGWRNN